MYYFFFVLSGHVSNNLDKPQFLLDKELSFLHLLKCSNLHESKSRISETSLTVKFEPCCRSDRVAERLTLPTSDHEETGSSPAGDKIIP